MDKDSDVSKIFRHNKLRLVGFWIYLCLLLLKVESLHFHGVLSFLNSIEWWFILGIAIIVSIVSAYLSGWIWYIYFKAPLRSSRETPTKLRSIMKLIFQYISPSIIFLGLFALPILMYADLQEQPDANACLVSGLKNFAEGEYTEAIEDFNIAIAVDSNNAGAYFNRGSAYYKKREFAYAIVDLDKAIALDPQNQSARDLREAAQRKLEN